MITSLNLKDFKCFESFESPLQFSQINLLTGCNGRGKSSVFQSLLLLAQSFRSGKNFEFLRLNGRYVKLGTFADVLRRQSNSAQFSIGFTSDDEDENNVSFVFKSSDNDPRIANISSLQVKYTDGKERELIISVGGKDDNSNEETSVTTATSAIKAINQLRNVYFISADRQGPQNYVVREDERSGNNVGIHGEYAIHTLLEKEKEILPTVVDTISHIMGGASISVKDIDTEYIKLLIDSDNDNEGFKPVNVGFGYSYILPVIVLPLVVDEGSKLFVENPEAHLHPGAQARLMEFLINISKKKNLQLFIETHSDHIVNALRIATKKKLCGLTNSDSQIIHLSHDNIVSNFCQIKLDREGNLSDYPKEFMDEWTKQMLDLV